MPRTRLRADYRFGTITNAPLLVGGTTLNSAELANFPAVSANEYAAITLHDPATGDYEIVYVTAHTASATSATIERAAAGSTAQEWPAGTAWLHGATARDYQDSIDPPWPGDLGYDEEFERYSTSLPSPWSWVNQGSSTYRQEHSRGIITHQVVTGDNWRLITRALPTQSTWEATAKIDLMSPSAQFTFAGFVLRESGTGKFTAFDIRQNTAKLTNMVELLNWNSPTSFGTTTQAAVEYAMPLKYLRLRRNSATSWDFEVSHSGALWLTAVSGVNVTTHLAGGGPDQIGFGICRTVASQAEFGIDWFRVR